MIVLGLIFLAGAAVFAAASFRHHARMRAATTRAICLDQRQDRDDDATIGGVLLFFGLLMIFCGVTA